METTLLPKKDFIDRPLWILANGSILLETSARYYKEASSLLSRIGEKVVSDCEMEEYVLSKSSISSASSLGLDRNAIMKGLSKLSKTTFPIEVKRLVENSTLNSGLKLLVHKNKHFLKCKNSEVANEIINDEVISKTIKKRLESNMIFQLEEEKVASLRKYFLKKYGNCPILVEYNFSSDKFIPKLDLELKSLVKAYPYQEQALQKIFSNGNVRSGVIDLPHGSGKTLIGVSVACQVKKCCLCVVRDNVSAEKWEKEFETWTTLDTNKISLFTSARKDEIWKWKGAGVIITTYSMLNHGGERSQASKQTTDLIRNGQWGLILMDEFHTIPKRLLGKVIDTTSAHCRIGLSASLGKHDENVVELISMVGPMLYQGKRKFLAMSGLIGNIYCVEVRCSMPEEVFKTYLEEENHKRKKELSSMNPKKFRALEYLVKIHKDQGCKIVIMSDDNIGLQKYFLLLGGVMINKETSVAQRMEILTDFRNSIANPLFLSEVFDELVDVPEANIFMKISSQVDSQDQDARRLGHIFRGKSQFRVDEEDGDEKYDGMFYSFVSTDTEEMRYSVKLQQFCVEEGCKFKVLTNCPPPSYKPIICPSDAEFLEKVMSAIDDGAG